MFEKKVLRRIYESKMVEVKGYQRKVHNKKLHNLYSSPNSISIIKSRRIRQE